MSSTEPSFPSSLRRVSVVGLGKLGAPLAVCLAYKGYQVVGVDLDGSKRELFSKGIPPTFEPGLRELLQSVRGKLTVTDNYEEAVENSDATFILVPTPSDDRGTFSLRYVVPACERIGNALRRKPAFHLVVLTSTVLPTMTENEVKPVLEASSGKRCGVEFGLCYNPEFVSLGSVVRDLLCPDFILIGQSDTYSGDILASLYKQLCENNAPIARMNFVNAELTKLAVNTFVTTKITFANMLARICERLPGANVDMVTSALGMDSRIGGKYLKGAIGYGGPCFPRDNAALAFLGRLVGSPATLAEATDGANRQGVHQLVEIVKSRLTKDGVIGILGLTYKTNTDVVEESQGLLLAQSLMAEGFSVAVYDPAGMRNAKAVLNSCAIFTDSAQHCIQLADVVVLTTPWEEFSNLPPQAFFRKESRRVLVDCWRVLNPENFKEVVEYLPLGIGDEVAER